LNKNKKYTGSEIVVSNMILISYVNLVKGGIISFFVNVAIGAAVMIVYYNSTSCPPIPESKMHSHVEYHVPIPGSGPNIEIH